MVRLSLTIPSESRGTTPSESRGADAAQVERAWQRFRPSGLGLARQRSVPPSFHARLITRFPEKASRQPARCWGQVLAPPEFLIEVEETAVEQWPSSARAQ